MPKKLDRYEFIWRAIQKHGYKYDYREVDYVNAIEKVCIICPIHGKFCISPHIHVSKYNNCGCFECGRDVRWDTRGRITTEEFIKRAREVHNHKYDYSKSKYKGIHKKICIVCPEHGEFWQTPSHHICRKQGCPICKASSLENEMHFFLKENNIKYEYQKKFDWLGSQSLDFYLTDYNIAIECQGVQHFFPIKHFGGEEEFQKTLKRDKRKKELCKNNNIKIIYYAGEESYMPKA